MPPFASLCQLLSGSFRFAGGRGSIRLVDPEAGSQPKAGSAGQLYALKAPGDLADLLESLHVNQQTGRLDLRFAVDHCLGTVYVRQGNVCYASFSGAKGLDALLKMAQAGSGNVVFHPGAQPDTANLELEMAALLAELRQPPSRPPAPAAPTATMVPAPPPPEPAPAAAPTPPFTPPPEPVPTGGGRSPRRWLAAALLALGLAAAVSAPWWWRFLRPTAAEAPATASAAPRQLQLRGEALRQRFAELSAHIPAGDPLDLKLRQAQTLLAAAEGQRLAGRLPQARPILARLAEAAAWLEALNQERLAAVQLRDALQLTVTGLPPLPAGAPGSDRLAEALAREKSGTQAYAACRYPEAATAWREAQQLLATAAEEHQRHLAMKEAQQQFEEAMARLDLAALRTADAAAMARIQALQESARAKGQARQYAEAAADWRMAARQIPRAAESVEAARQRQERDRLLQAGLTQIANQQWPGAIATLEQAQAMPGAEADPELQAALAEAKAGRVLVEALAAKITGDWEAVKRHSEAALALIPAHPTARQLHAESIYNLTPRLTLTAEAGGKTVRNAILRLNDGPPRAVTLPYSLTGTLGERNHIILEAGGFDDECLAPAELAIAFREKRHQEVKVSFLPLPAPSPNRQWIVPSLGLVLLPIPAGSFRMGSLAGQEDERPVHSVTFTRPFWMARTETTNRQYRIFLKESGYHGRDDSAESYLRHFTRTGDMPTGDDHPVCYVGWKNAAAFCGWLTACERRRNRLPPGYAYRLPTEAEWEYAARAGRDDTTLPILLTDWGWYRDNSPRQNRRVAQKLANPWGLYDLQGNLWEWCLDWEAPYPDGPRTDPPPSAIGLFKIVRGGSWDSDASSCRPANRNAMPLTRTDPSLGFRAVLAPILATP